MCVPPLSSTHNCGFISFYYKSANPLMFLQSLNPGRMICIPVSVSWRWTVCVCVCECCCAGNKFVAMCERMNSYTLVKSMLTGLKYAFALLSKHAQISRQQFVCCLSSGMCSFFNNIFMLMYMLPPCFFSRPRYVIAWWDFTIYLQIWSWLLLHSTLYSSKFQFEIIRKKTVAFRFKWSVRP